MTELLVPRDGDLVVGDVHGCYSTFLNLVIQSKINLDKNRVWFVGDVIDKGPEQLEILQWMEKFGAISTNANHENKHFRWSAPNSKVKVTAEMADCKKQLGDAWYSYAQQFGAWPNYIAFEDSQGPGYLLHAGVGSEEHFDTLDKQPKNYLIMMRTDPFTVYEKGKELAAPIWQNKYNGRFGTILHGHIPSPSAQYHGNKMVYSLDGGPAYGNSKEWQGCMRGLILGERRIVEVLGRKEDYLHYISLED